MREPSETELTGSVGRIRVRRWPNREARYVALIVHDTASTSAATSTSPSGS